MNFLSFFLITHFCSLIFLSLSPSLFYMHTHTHTFFLMLHHPTGTVPGRRKMIQARGEFVKYTLERLNHVNYYE